MGHYLLELGLDLRRGRLCVSGRANRAGSCLGWYAPGLGSPPTQDPRPGLSAYGLEARSRHEPGAAVPRIVAWGCMRYENGSPRGHSGARPSRGCRSEGTVQDKGVGGALRRGVPPGRELATSTAVRAALHRPSLGPIPIRVLRGRSLGQAFTGGRSSALRRPPSPPTRARAAAPGPDFDLLKGGGTIVLAVPPRRSGPSKAPRPPRRRSGPK